MERAKAILAHYVLTGKVVAARKASLDEVGFLNRLDRMLEEGSFRMIIVTYQANPKLLEVLNYTNSILGRGVI